MAISRPFLLAVLGAVLLGATMLAVQNARNTTGSDAAPAAIKADPAPAPAQTSSSAPAETLKSAFDLSTVKSGRFAAKLSFHGRPGATSLGASGVFERGTANELPHFSVTAQLGSGKQALGGGFVSLGDKAYFVRGDTGWRVPTQVWQSVGQNKLQFAVHPGTWVRDAKSQGTESVGGVQTEHISGKLDPQAMLNDVAGVTGGGARLSKPQIAGVKGTSLDVWVGKQDHVLRRLTAQLVLPGRARLDLQVGLSDINKPQKIQAPAHLRAGAPPAAVSPFASLLVGKIDRVTGTKTASLEALSSPNPGRAARAVADHKKVVILFTNKRGLDDRAMTSVIRDVDRRTKALVLSDPVDAVDRYGKLVQDLGVSETPSIVIIDSKGRARLIEGYVDSDTLAQAVADTR
jgi:hypothetical protein